MQRCCRRERGSQQRRQGPARARREEVSTEETPRRSRVAEDLCDRQPKSHSLPTETQPKLQLEGIDLDNAESITVFAMLLCSAQTSGEVIDSAAAVLCVRRARVRDLAAAEKDKNWRSRASRLLSTRANWIIASAETSPDRSGAVLAPSCASCRSFEELEEPTLSNGGERR
jgi:hypothetical protein